LWYFSAAELARLLGVKGWEDDAAMTGFGVRASLAAMMGLQCGLQQRGWEAGLVVILAATE